MTKKQIRNNTIKEAAKKLIIETNIEKTTFNQIAQLAGVGEATVYRYFANKGELVQEIVIDYITDVYNDLSEQNMKENISLHTKLEVLIDYYIKLFINKPDYYIFLEKFDNFISYSEKKPERFAEYEKIFNDIKELSMSDFDSEYDNEKLRLAEHTFSKNFVSHCQKLLLRGTIMSDDIDHSQISELELLKKMYLDYLKTNIIKGN